MLRQNNRSTYHHIPFLIRSLSRLSILANSLVIHNRTGPLRTDLGKIETNQSLTLVNAAIPVPTPIRPVLCSGVSTSRSLPISASFHRSGRKHAGAPDLGVGVEDLVAHLVARGTPQVLAPSSDGLHLVASCYLRLPRSCGCGCRATPVVDPVVICGWYWFRAFWVVSSVGWTSKPARSPSMGLMILGVLPSNSEVTNYYINCAKSGCRWGYVWLQVFHIGHVPCALRNVPRWSNIRALK